ncbi:MAG: FdrA family protein, partial [Carbonactinosporaceae bacterium]
FCGGTLCDEAMVIATAALGPVASNASLEGEWGPGADLRAPGHVMIDFGDGRLTAGRPHPMIDPGLRLEQFVHDVADPGTAVVLLDVVLGYGAHPDPASGVAEELRAARSRSVDTPVVVALIGSPRDPQGLEGQARALQDAGAHVFLSNAAAARHAVALVEGG